MTQGTVVDRPSLEGLVETGILELESLHPGGLDTTQQLAEMCHIHRGDRLLDVACGTGESACFLAEKFGARVCGIDHSQEMVRRAENKAEARELDALFKVADAASLPFNDSEFDIVICECTLCFLDKAHVLSEMVRVVRPGGYIGMHDLCWREGASDSLKHTLMEIEGEDPETLEGWSKLFEGAGLAQIVAVDKSEVKSRWMREVRKQLGISGQLSLALKVIRRWGLHGAWTVFRSERVFSDHHLGYGFVVGQKQ